MMDKLCIHSITNKPLDLHELAEKYKQHGVGAVSVWRNLVEKHSAGEVARVFGSHGIRIASLARGGFFPSTSAKERKRAIDENRLVLEQAAGIHAPLVVLVCGSSPDQPLSSSVSQILDGIEVLLPLAESLNIRLAIEPLHPMYADTRSAINTLAHANDIAELFNSPYLGVAVDVYHLWWDTQLEDQIMRCGAHGKLLAYHICDWKSPTHDMLNDREIMGKGCIDLQRISAWMRRAGFQGFREVEIFSNRYWKMDQDAFLDEIIKAYQQMNFTT